MKMSFREVVVPEQALKEWGDIKPEGKGIRVRLGSTSSCVEQGCGLGCSAAWEGHRYCNLYWVSKLVHEIMHQEWCQEWELSRRARQKVWKQGEQRSHYDEWPWLQARHTSKGTVDWEGDRGSGDFTRVRQTEWVRCVTKRDTFKVGKPGVWKAWKRSSCSGSHGHCQRSRGSSRPLWSNKVNSVSEPGKRIGPEVAATTKVEGRIMNNIVKSLEI